MVSRVVIGRRVAMSLISLLLNLLWIVFGGLWMALGWVIAAVVMAITIVGLPWARAAFSIAAYTLLPFGYKAVPRDEYLGREDVGGSGPLVPRCAWTGAALGPAAGDLVLLADAGLVGEPDFYCVAHPVPDDLKSDTADLGRLGARCPIVDSREC